MKYAHTYDVTQGFFPKFWEKEHFQVALNRLDTSRMSSIDKALYENMLMRAKIVADKNQQILEEERTKVIETLKREAVKKLLLTELLTIEQIAEVQDTSVDFVKQVKKNLSISQKRKVKKAINQDK